MDENANVGKLLCALFFRWICVFPERHKTKADDYMMS
jgi:hypothetical protein